MDRRKSIFNWNHISEKLKEDQISELKALYKFYHKKYWLFKMTYKYFKKAELTCNIVSALLVVTGTVVGGVTLNPIPLGTISGSGLLLKTYSEAKNYKRKIEMCKFAYTTYEKVLPRQQDDHGTIVFHCQPRLTMVGSVVAMVSDHGL